jgi:hypothetical protein
MGGTALPSCTTGHRDQLSAKRHEENALWMHRIGQ